MKTKIKNGRIWLKNLNEFKGRFIEIFIANKDKEASFITFLSKDKRIYIPIKIRETLKIKDEVNIVKIKIIENKKRRKFLLKNNLMDLISVIPEKTLSGYDIVVIEKDDSYLCWYCTQGRPKELLIKKEIPGVFLRFLGYYQAEGGKPKLTKRRGRTLSFSNTKFEIIKDFFKLSENLLDKNLWNATINYNKKIERKDIEDLILKLKELGIQKDKIKIHPREKIKNYSIILWISNSILAETIDNLNNKSRDLILKTKNKALFENYFRGVIAGDGNFFSYRDKKGSLHSWLSIYEEKEHYILRYKEILEKYGLNGKIRKDKDKNLYILVILANWEKLLNLLKYDIFLYTPKHKDRLLWTIKNHKKYRALKYLTKLEDKFDIKDIKNISNKNYSYAAHWIKKRKREDIILPKEIIENRQSWELTDKGKEVRKILRLI